ncbi:DUF5067 domain-containing protein [Staphylococcus simulans]|uniref:DUF5067 domain-containing protein n=1 Tax=Staphylococcus simulans TaxID=1286 RepID=UPI000D1D9531|nr:DUF5067 domain-containing protein [Staphylococcus simulans]PTJ46479.1 DUF5067 domain-containing protein [Staphylococcus simulans]
MKIKLLGTLALSSALLLTACGQEDNKKEENNKVSKVNENKPTFKDNTLVLDQATLKIEDISIIHDKDANEDLLAFKYEVKNKSDSQEITPLNVWIAAFEAIQDDEDTESKLEVGVTPNTGKYESWSEHSMDTIKENGSAKGIITYTLKTKNDVVLKAKQGVNGKELGQKRIKIDDLKREDYSLTQDIAK